MVHLVAPRTALIVAMAAFVVAGAGPDMGAQSKPAATTG